MSAIHPIPNGYYCVPSALIALTGADPASVIIPAINRHSRARDLLEAPAGVCLHTTRAVLEELGYSVRRYRADATAGNLVARVSSWLNVQNAGQSEPSLLRRAAVSVRRAMRS